ncbi:NAD(P)/FAD-dependent oxidoreductase [Williamsia muralis]|uniref:NAD(P)/FAD-dependent oxidoreductase n=1 Tax=Williamsia marianensis TaxID=85044 RepID=UPI00380E3C6F
MTIRTVATVGAGQVAAVVARTLRRRGFDGRIMLLGNEIHAPYQRPPLSKEFLSGRESIDSLALLPHKWLSDNNIDLRTGVSVDRVDPSGRAIELVGGERVDVDAVVFATGGRPRTLPIAGTRQDLVHYLRTIDDALALSAHLTPGARLAIIGGGFIGLEVASTAVSLGVGVTVLERGRTPLAEVLGPQMSEFCTGVHRAQGVDVRTSVGVQTVNTSDAGVRITLSDGSVVEADTAVVGIGIEPNTEVAAASGVAIAHGIVVDPAGRTDMPNIYAAGDVACRIDGPGGLPTRAEHFDNANRQAGVVANAIIGRDTTADDPPWFWSDQYGMNLQLAGHVAGATDTVVRGNLDGGEFTTFYLRGDTLQAAFAVDRGEDLMAARELIGRVVDPAVLSDEDVDLWELGEQVVG